MGLDYSHVVVGIALSKDFQDHQVKLFKRVSSQELKPVSVELSFLIVIVSREKVDACLGLLQDRHQVSWVFHRLGMADHPCALFLVLVLLLVSLYLPHNISEHRFSVEYDHARLLEISRVRDHLASVGLDGPYQSGGLLGFSIYALELNLGSFDQRGQFVLVFLLVLKSCRLLRFLCRLLLRFSLGYWLGFWCSE